MLAAAPLAGAFESGLSGVVERGFGGIFGAKKKSGRGERRMAAAQISLAKRGQELEYGSRDKALSVEQNLRGREMELAANTAEKQINAQREQFTKGLEFQKLQADREEKLMREQLNFDKNALMAGQNQTAEMEAQRLAAMTSRFAAAAPSPSAPIIIAIAGLVLTLYLAKRRRAG